MSCKDKINSGQDSSKISESTRIEEMESIPNPPSEIFGSGRTLSEEHEEAIKLALTRGQHKVRTIIKYSGEPKTLDNISKKIKIEDEFKRVFYHKIDISPISDDKAYMTATFHVLDNPLPLVPIIYGASITASATAGYFLVDKVESFTDTIAGKVSIAITAVIAYFTLFK